ncbi:MAG: SAM-dependent methyltransferase, partial [Chloroflexota bacterium]|nr:SAM-dependent methyltransferase [Chloroflexota bacterium]
MSELEELVRERIRREGPLPFREVMQAALYHPRLGYYTNLRGFGKDGDFITSPERHPAFGYLLGRQALDVWQALDRPQPFRILELGAGSGALAEPLVSLVQEVVPELVYTIDETSPSLRSVQQARLTGAAFRWDGTDEPAHFILANEVADALPVDRVVVRDGRLHELRVGLDARAALTWVEHESAGAEILAYFDALHYLPPEGGVADVCTGLAGWVASLARRLERGVALVRDYGASPPGDSLLTYYRHTMASDPLVRLGQQDISAHVDLRT